MKIKIKYHEWEGDFKAYTAIKDFISTLLSGDGLPALYADPSSMTITNNSKIHSK